jgi:hypothetical protein
MRIESVSVRQSILDEFEVKQKNPLTELPEEYENQERLRRELHKHVNYMERLFARIIEDLEGRC